MLILAISGSLRAGSSNTAVLDALRLLAPPDVIVERYDRLDRLPYFNPDLDGATVPVEVAALRHAVGASDAIVISSPEYAHGMPGVLKNALDWLVGGFEFPGKPVALINTLPRAIHAQASLVETLTTMSARVIPDASVAVPLLARGLDGATIAADDTLSRTLRAALAALGQATGVVTDPTQPR